MAEPVEPQTQHDNDRTLWGFVWGFFFNLIGMLGIVIFAEGEQRRTMLRGAFVGWITSMIVAAVLIFIVYGGGFSSSGSGVLNDATRSSTLDGMVSICAGGGGPRITPCRCAVDAMIADRGLSGAYQQIIYGGGTLTQNLSVVPAAAACLR